MNNAKNIKEVLSLLEVYYPHASTSLRYENVFQLLVAVMLSARSTDEQVNTVTPDLFACYGSTQEMAQASSEDIEKLIKRCGLAKSKSRNLVKVARVLVDFYDGQVPDNWEHLISLPGVGRKTANVLISTAFNKPAIAVDTHVYRVSKRLGWAVGNKTEEVEKELMQIIPRELWAPTHHRLIAHGRSLCYARRPRCKECFLHNLCSAEIS